MTVSPYTTVAQVATESILGSVEFHCFGGEFAFGVEDWNTTHPAELGSTLLYPSLASALVGE